MTTKLSLEDFYTNNLSSVPENLNKGLGHFNVFQLDEFASENPKPMPFNRRDYYKVSLVKGKAKIHYADKIIKVNQDVLVFSNPQIPYNWEKIDQQLTGYFCIFTETFFHQFGNTLSYPIFQPNGNHVFLLSENQAETFTNIFKKMFPEINSDYTYKYDVLRNLVSDLIHSAQKLEPALSANTNQSNASERITFLFTDLLERQFPIEHINQKIQLRAPGEFAEKLNIHVNHLNRALKETTEKTTGLIISERILQEAKILLTHTNWNVSEIARCLNFEEASHFSNFFKRNVNKTAINFRKDSII